jgi:hypothetical protein
METPTLNPGAYGSTPAAVGGQFFDEQPRQVDTRVSGESTSSIPFGVGVVHQAGDADTLVRLPTATNFEGAGSIIEGITGFSSKVDTLQSPFYLSDAGTLVSGVGPIAPGRSCDVLRKGRVWVLVENAVAKGGAVYMRVTANGGLTQLGSFRADSDSGNAVLIEGAVYDTTQATGGSPAAVRFDFDAQNAVSQQTETTYEFEMKLADIATGAMAKWTPGFAGKIKSIQATVDEAATTASKLATLTPAIGGTSVTGGALALTSANCTPVGAEIDGSAITGANSFKATDQLSLVASSVTTFQEGVVTVTVTVVG